MSQSFCETCGTFVEPNVITRSETYPVRGESVTVTARVAVCPVSGDELSNEMLDDETLAAAFAVYRSRHGLIQPEEIKSIRLRYGLGQKAFSRLLGMGEITLHRYEGGSLQTSAQNTVLELARDPGFVRRCLEQNGTSLSEHQRATLVARLDELTQDCAEPVVREERAVYEASEPCVTKMREMIVFFAGRPNTYRTTLNKLLFYADFLHHKRHGTSISKLRYVHMQFGPVPAGFYRLQAELVEDTSVREKEIWVDQWEGTLFEAERPADLGVLTTSELECVQLVAAHFDGWTARRVTEHSHTEAAWLETHDGETISYEFAQRLSLD